MAFNPDLFGQITGARGRPRPFSRHPWLYTVLTGQARGTPDVVNAALGEIGENARRAPPKRG